MDEAPRVMDVYDQRRAALAAFIRRRGVTVMAVCKKTGIPKTTLYGYLKGGTKNLNLEYLTRIAEALGAATVDQMFSTRELAATTVEVIGRFGEGGVAFLGDRRRVAVPPVIPAGGDYQAFEVGDFVIPPAEPGWLLVFQPYDGKGKFKGMLHQTGCFMLSDGRYVFRRLLKGGQRDRYHLEAVGRAGAGLIRNAHVVRAMTFVALVKAD